MIVDKKDFQGRKTKLIFENLILLQKDFVCWWNLHLNMSDYFNRFMSSGNERSACVYDLLFHPARKG